MHEAALEALRLAAGPPNVSVDVGRRLIFAADATGRMQPPAAVVRALDAAQIGRILAACTAFGLKITPRGAGSGLTGGATPLAGGVVLDLAGMDKIIRVDQADQLAVVQPGVVNADLQRAARQQGLFYPPDPASADFCTIGGNVAENAGGLRAVKYGVTRDYVLALQAVLADGRIMRVGSPTMKGVVGYDLTRLLVGSEGTLAVITEITLKLLPLPEATATLCALYAQVEAAALAVRRILAGGARPVALEFMDAASLRAVEAHAGLGLDPTAAAMILVELDGPPEVLARQAQWIEATLTQSGGKDVRRASGGAEAEAIWAARRAMSPALRKIAAGKLNEDIVVPLGSLATMIRRLEGVAARRGVDIVSFGHAGDGNLHVNIMYDPADQAQTQAARQALTDVFAQTLALGGTVSGEHGVGTAKLAGAAVELDPTALELMRAVKKVFDPAGILNPGKGLPPLEGQR
ncbi:D-lactate dehydrogenase (cytochrome) [Desulfarculus baarsii DSM 2075]|uniref:D-lactate dehydrogenase (Cytochrome) n=1 Tax=Desulfarculus baarsii (strain ATCC 33931 / DSM 2075 / LMG 7858 / VKM B-1802 / 2st14) TaxID=644282 RepID=E1QH61_DESB2|nr:FAD-linked oxidase C-terminal domain-containing protein [Desulfarculus baarsii]ADK84904.1 D-lactate dehydrogenase (cytochrome) [Desulfarculus baarsii DSM 2075]